MGTGRYKRSKAHLRLLIHLRTRPVHTLCQLLTQLKSLPLVAGRGGVGEQNGLGGRCVSPHLLF